MADWSSDEEDGGSGAPEDAGAGEHTERFYNEKYNDLVSPARCSDSFGDVGRARPPALRPMLVALAPKGGAFAVSALSRMRVPALVLTSEFNTPQPHPLSAQGPRGRGGWNQNDRPGREVDQDVHATPGRHGAVGDGWRVPAASTTSNFADPFYWRQPVPFIDSMLRLCPCHFLPLA